jgi:uncharacterized protein (TIGR00251 family)
MAAPAWFLWDGEDLVLRLRVQPKASRDEFAGPQEHSYRVRITAPPVDGKANAHLIRFLAKAFGVSRTSVTLESGETSREKRVRIAAPTRLPIADLGPPNLTPSGRPAR